MPDPVPWCLGQAGCGAYVHNGFSGAFRQCSGEVVAAGLVRTRRREVWLAFSCELHRDQLEDPRPLTDEELAELEWRREQSRLALAGRRYQKVRPL